MNITKRNKVALAIGTGALVVGTAGAAMAYWTSSGSGTGTASTGTASDDLAYSNTTISGMAPGVTPASFTATVTNNGSQNAYVNTLTAYLTVSTDATNPAVIAGGTCDETDYTLDDNTNADISHPVTLSWTATDIGHVAPSNTHATSGSDTLGFNDKQATDQDACQGATVTINYASN